MEERMEETRVCKCCGKELPIENFYRNGWGITSYCKECHTVKAREGKMKKKELQQKAEDADNARKLRLKDFTHRELMEELRNRGYEGKLRYVKVEEIDLSKI